MIEVSDYGAFLNAVATVDPQYLYDEKMNVQEATCSLMIRSGTSGSYGYEVNEENKFSPRNYISWSDALRYCNWVEQGRPLGEEGVTSMEEERLPSQGPDPFLKSNKITFARRDVIARSKPSFLGYKVSSGNDDVSSSLWKDTVAIGSVLSAIAAPVGELEERRGEYEEVADARRNALDQEELRYSPFQAVTVMDRSKERGVEAFRGFQFSDDEDEKTVTSQQKIVRRGMTRAGSRKSFSRERPATTSSNRMILPALSSSRSEASLPPSREGGGSLELPRWDFSAAHKASPMSHQSRRKPQPVKLNPISEVIEKTDTLSPVTCENIFSMEPPSPPSPKIMSNQETLSFTKAKQLLTKTIKSRKNYPLWEAVPVLRRNGIPAIHAVEGVNGSSAMWQLLSRKVEKIHSGTVIFNNHDFFIVGSAGIELYPPTPSVPWYLFPMKTEQYVAQGKLTKIHETNF